MSEIAQLREAASHLSPPDRAELAAFILGSLDEAHHSVDDEEVMRRREELDSGEVKSLTLSELREACGRWEDTLMDLVFHPAAAKDAREIAGKYAAESALQSEAVSVSWVV